MLYTVVSFSYVHSVADLATIRLCITYKQHGVSSAPRRTRTSILLSTGPKLTNVDKVSAGESMGSITTVPEFERALRIFKGEEAYR